MTLRLVAAVLVVAFLALAYVAWNRSHAPATSAPVPTPAAEDPSALPTLDQKPAGDPGVRWDVPKRWVAQLGGAMRLATYVVPGRGAPAEDAECGVYFFGPGEGGDVDANLARWSTELENASPPKKRSWTQKSLRISRIEVTGTTYRTHGNPNGAEAPHQAGWTLLGAIVEGPNGSIFFKLTGPSATVAGGEREFDAMLASLARK